MPEHFNRLIAGSGGYINYPSRIAVDSPRQSASPSDVLARRHYSVQQVVAGRYIIKDRPDMLNMFINSAGGFYVVQSSASRMRSMEIWIFWTFADIKRTLLASSCQWMIRVKSQRMQYNHFGFNRKQLQT